MSVLIVGQTFCIGVCHRLNTFEVLEEDFDTGFSMCHSGKARSNIVHTPLAKAQSFLAHACDLLLGRSAPKESKQQCQVLEHFQAAELCLIVVQSKRYGKPDDLRTAVRGFLHLDVDVINHYRVLGVPHDATPAAIQAAYSHASVERVGGGLRKGQRQGITTRRNERGFGFDAITDAYSVLMVNMCAQTNPNPNTPSLPPIQDHSKRAELDQCLHLPRPVVAAVAASNGFQFSGEHPPGGRYLRSVQHAVANLCRWATLRSDDGRDVANDDDFGPVPATFDLAMPVEEQVALLRASLCCGTHGYAMSTASTHLRLERDLLRAFTGGGEAELQRLLHGSGNNVQPRGPGEIRAHFHGQRWVVILALTKTANIQLGTTRARNTHTHKLRHSHTRVRTHTRNEKGHQLRPFLVRPALAQAQANGMLGPKLSMHPLEDILSCAAENHNEQVRFNLPIRFTCGKLTTLAAL